MNWNNTQVAKAEYYHMLSMIAIKNDAETLKAIATILSDPILSLGILPYYALFCVSIEEYYKSKGVEHNFFAECPFKISDVRDTLKLFDGKYSKMETLVHNIDNIQDENFRNKLRYPILGLFNLYYNIGVFFYNKCIISNTQYMYYMFQDKKLSNETLLSNQIKEFAKALGIGINSVSIGLKDFMPDYHINVFSKQFPIVPKNFNTNKNFNFFPECKNGKELSLRILHILSSINFVRYILADIVPDDNIWLLRIKYISMYYANKNVKIIVEKIPDFPLKSLVTDDTELFDSEFRSCMMHYSFINKDNYIIDDNNIDFRKPFFGLIESRFNGMSYDDFSKNIDKKITELSDKLSNIVSLHI